LSRCRITGRIQQSLRVVVFVVAVVVVVVGSGECKTTLACYGSFARRDQQRD